jgi:hypothetical protein
MIAQPANSQAPDVQEPAAVGSGSGLVKHANRHEDAAD